MEDTPIEVGAAIFDAYGTLLNLHAAMASQPDEYGLRDSVREIADLAALPALPALLA